MSSNNGNNMDHTTQGATYHLDNRTGRFLYLTREWGFAPDQLWCFNDDTLLAMCRDLITQEEEGIV